MKPHRTTSTPFKSIGLKVDPYSSSDSEVDEDAMAAASSKFMRSVAKVTAGGHENGHGGGEEDGSDSGEEEVAFGAGRGPVTPNQHDRRTAPPRENAADDQRLEKTRSAAGLMKLLDSGADLAEEFAVNFTENFDVVTKSKRKAGGDDEGTGGNFDSSGSYGGGGSKEGGRGRDGGGGGGESDSQDGSGSDAEFGGHFTESGVPLHEFKALQLKLSLVVGKFKASKKEFSSSKKSAKSMEEKLKVLQVDADEMKVELEETYLKLTEEIKKKSTGAVVGGGGGGAGGAALEEQRRKQREDARKALFSGADEDEDEGYHAKADDLSVFKDFFLRAHKRINKLMPLSSDVRSVQGHFGSSVASFFSFYRWIIITNLWAGILCAVYLVLHLYALWSAGYANTFSM